MFARLIYESFRRQRRRKLLAGVAITLGMSVATAMIAVATDIGDKINRELRTYGANLVVYPDQEKLDVEIGGVSLKPAGEGAYLNEADLPKIKGTFWRHNIVSFAPVLPVQTTVDVAESRPNTGNRRTIPLVGTYFAKELKYGTDTFAVGARSMYPWWKVNGSWPADNGDDVLVGEALAREMHVAPGSDINAGGRELKVSGILSTGGDEDNEIIAPLGIAQAMIGRPGAVGRVYVSALTKPEDDFGRRDPRSLSPADYDRWYCSPYANSIAFQLQEAIPHSRAEQIRQVAQNEGTVLS